MPFVVIKTTFTQANNAPNVFIATNEDPRTDTQEQVIVPSPTLVALVKLIEPCTPSAVTEGQLSKFADDRNNTWVGELTTGGTVKVGLPWVCLSPLLM